MTIYLIGVVIAFMVMTRAVTKSSTITKKDLPYVTILVIIGSLSSWLLIAYSFILDILKYILSKKEK